MVIRSRKLSASVGRRFTRHFVGQLDKVVIVDGRLALIGSDGERRWEVAVNADLFAAAYEAELREQ